MWQIVWGTVGLAVLLLIAGAWALRVAMRALEGPRATDAPAMVVRPTGPPRSDPGPRLRWESGLALQAVQRDSAARLERRKRERDAAIFTAVKRGAVIQMRTRGER